MWVSSILSNVSIQLLAVSSQQLMVNIRLTPQLYVFYIKTIVSICSEFHLSQVLAGRMPALLYNFNNLCYFI